MSGEMGVILRTGVEPMLSHYITKRCEHAIVDISPPTLDAVIPAAPDGQYTGPLQHGLRHGIGVLDYQVCRSRQSGVHARLRQSLSSLPLWWRDQHACPSGRRPAQASLAVFSADHCMPLPQIGKSAARYEGQFARGVREGLGVITAGDGAHFEGGFKGDLMWGPGAGLCNGISFLDGSACSRSPNSYVACHWSVSSAKNGC